MSVQSTIISSCSSRQNDQCSCENNRQPEMVYEYELRARKSVVDPTQRELQEVHDLLKQLDDVDRKKEQIVEDIKREQERHQERVHRLKKQFHAIAMFKWHLRSSKNKAMKKNAIVIDNMQQRQQNMTIIKSEDLTESDNDNNNNETVDRSQVLLKVKH